MLICNFEPNFFCLYPLSLNLPSLSVFLILYATHPKVASLTLLILFFYDITLTTTFMSLEFSCNIIRSHLSETTSYKYIFLTSRIKRGMIFFSFVPIATLKPRSRLLLFRYSFLYHERVCLRTMPRGVWVWAQQSQGKHTHRHG